MKVQVDSGLREERINIPREFVPVFIFEDDGRSGRDNVVLVLLAVLSMLDHYHNRGFFVPVEGLLPVCWVIPRWLKITLVYSSHNGRRTPKAAHSRWRTPISLLPSMNGLIAFRVRSGMMNYVRPNTVIARRHHIMHHRAAMHTMH